MCSPHQWNWTLARLHISLHYTHFCDYYENNINKPSKQELKVCTLLPPATFTLSHYFDWNCGWQTWIDMALWNGVLKWSLTYLTGREGPWGFYPSLTSEWSSPPSWEWRRNLALLQDCPSSPFLTSWRVPGKCVHIKPIKVSSSMVGLNQVRVFMENLWIVHFSPSFWQSRLTLKSLYFSHLKWQTNVQKTQGQFLFLLLEYSSAHLHMDLRTICFLTRFTVQYGTVGQKAEYKSALSHYTSPPLLFFND